MNTQTQTHPRHFSCCSWPIHC